MSIKELKNRIKAVSDTQKITNAMYLISSTKMRKAKRDLDNTRPYFEAVHRAIKRIFRTSANVESRYFYPASGEHDLGGSYGYLVISSDKGLAGAYNKNVLRLAEQELMTHSNPKLFVVGEYGRHYFASKHIPIEKSFLYTAQNPTLSRAREIAEVLLESFVSGEITKLFIVYTDLKSAMSEEAICERILPFHRARFMDETVDALKSDYFEFVTPIEEVLDNIVPSYMIGFIYSTLVDSFCSEQNARINAMDSANRNAQKLIDNLSLTYNHMRQGAITQEITEISAGSKGLKRKKNNIKLTGGLQG